MGKEEGGGQISEARGQKLDRGGMDERINRQTDKIFPIVLYRTASPLEGGRGGGRKVGGQNLEAGG